MECDLYAPTVVFVPHMLNGHAHYVIASTVDEYRHLNDEASSV